MTDSEKLLIISDACSDLVLGGERGWERMDFKEFVSMCRKAIAKGVKSEESTCYLCKVKLVGMCDTCAEKETRGNQKGVCNEY